MKFDKNKIFWWSPRPLFGLDVFQKENFGDVLGIRLTEKIVNKKNKKLSEINKSKLLTIGSILHFANNNDTVWGSGVNGKINTNLLQFNSLDVRSVRGPLTWEILTKKGINVPEVFGDPGILTSFFWERTQNIETNKIIYIPHMREKPVKDKRYQILSPLSDFDYFLKEIQTAEKVISSSLHGVVVAESYGIPANLILNNSGEALFKYQDYYYGTNRENFKTFSNVSDALIFDPEIPTLTTSAENVLSKFPLDLWD